MILKRIQINTELNEQTNCYIIQEENTKETMVIDPGGQAQEILEMLKVINAKLKYIYLTHCHGDHIGAVNELRKAVGGKVLIHRFDSEGLKDNSINLTSYIGLEDFKVQEDARVDDEDIIHIGNLKFKILHTPGHTKGSSCLYCPIENLIFTGDTMFRGTWGRTDLPTGSFEEIMESISKKLIRLPENTIVYPGHGKSTMIREERPIYLKLQPRID